MLQSIVGPTISTDGQLWTVAVEWWLYMLAPIFKRWSAALLATLIVGSLVLYLRQRPPDNPALLGNGYLLVALCWLWIVGFLYHRWKRTPLGYAALFLPVTIAMAESWIGRAALLGVFAAALCEEVRVPPFLARPLNWLGELSYPLYAMHIPVFVMCALLHISSIPVILIAVLATSVATLHIIDLPLRRWGVAFTDRLAH
jgi:peptidoglycan/LPS O-acetylase OafA/YrhL